MSRILATGSALPKRRISNADLCQFPAHSLQLIEQKTGIRARRACGTGESASSLALAAGQAALSRSGRLASELDAIIVSTSTPDRLIPGIASTVQAQLGASRAWAFDLNAVCSGAIFAIKVAEGLLQSGQCTTILVVAADTYSRVLNPSDFSTYPYFGDGAGAVMLSSAKSGGIAEVGPIVLHTDGLGADLIQVPAGGYFAMRGREVFDFAVRRGPEIVAELLAGESILPGDVAHVLTHQANIKIIDAIAAKSGIPRERFWVDLDELGNTASASVLIAFDHLVTHQALVAKEHSLLVAFGAGLSWGGALLRH
jgi:3-oxoacyl-[acyl-carrier-protein] synthase-3